MTIADINELATKLLKDIVPINALIGSEQNIFESRALDEDDDFMDFTEDHSAWIAIKDNGNYFDAEVRDWYSHAICLTGIEFSMSSLVSAADVKSKSISLTASLVDGVGERYFYKALGTRELTVILKFNYDRSLLESEYEVRYVRFEVKSVLVKFLNETVDELDTIYSSLKAQDAKLQKQLTVSWFKGNYSNFKALTGLGEDELYKNYVKNERFDQLFDEE